MIAAMLLGAALLWLAIAIGLGAVAFRVSRKRWIQIVTTGVLLWLPFWDVIPGYYLYQRAVREVAGVRIHRTVQVEGYLDLTETDCNSCWSRLRDQRYGYLEIRRSGRTGVLVNAEQGAGYYAYRLLPRDDERRRLFDSLPNAEAMRAYHGLQERCLYWTVSATPVSQYEVSSGIDYYGRSEGLWPVELVWRRVTDRRSSQVLAQSTVVSFFSRLSHQIGIPSWRYADLPDGSHIYFGVEEVLVPE